MKPEEAVEKVIRTVKQHKGQPYFGKAVPLRHLCLALEMVSGMSYCEAMAELYHSLSTGALPADAINDQNELRVIPSRSWPKYDANNNAWCSGVIYFEHILPTFKGYMPVVGRDDANKWLSTYLPMPKAGRPGKQGAVLAAYLKIYGDSNHKQHGDSWKEVERKVAAILDSSVSLQTLKRALKEK